MTILLLQNKTLLKNRFNAKTFDHFYYHSNVLTYIKAHFENSENCGCKLNS